MPNSKKMGMKSYVYFEKDGLDAGAIRSRVECQGRGSKVDDWAQLCFFRLFEKQNNFSESQEKYRIVSRWTG